MAQAAREVDVLIRGSHLFDEAESGTDVVTERSRGNCRLVAGKQHVAYEDADGQGIHTHVILMDGASPRIEVRRRGPGVTSVYAFQAGEKTEIAYSTPEGTLRFPVDTHAVRIESGDKKITAEARYALRQGESKLMETVLVMEFRFRP